MQTSQLGQLHAALLHCHFFFRHYIPTSFNIPSFFIENLQFSLISFVNKSRVSEFYCVFPYHMTPRYIPSIFRIPSLGHIFRGSVSVFSFSVYAFLSSNHERSRFLSCHCFLSSLFAFDCSMPSFFSYWPRYCVQKDIT